MEIILDFWNGHSHFAWWQSLLICLFFLLANSLLFLAVWYLHRETILECGYKNVKAARKRFKEQSPVEKLLLTRLVHEAPKPHFNLILRLVLNWSNLVLAAAGWAMTLLLGSGLCSLLFSVGISFIPDLLWVPSERKRYGLRKKKK